MRATNASVPDVGRSLRLAREQARLTPEEAAERSGIPVTEVEALESGAVSRMRDRVETLRSLRSYANSLGLPGNEYVLAFVELWPTLDLLPTRAIDPSQLPVVSVTSAPLGGHYPAASNGRSGVTEFSVTGVVSPLGAQTVGDGAPISPVDTGELPKVRQAAPRMLKFLVGLAAVLVAAGIFTLAEHSHFATWQKQVRADSTNWVHDAKVAAGLSPKTRTHKGVVAAPGAPAASPQVVMKADPATSQVTVDVHASSFTVKIVAFKNPSWVQVTDSSQAAPIYQQVLPGGANTTFTVTGADTIETGSPSARAYLYEGTTFIGYYFPTEAPFIMNFNAVG
jgi:transcriptional regulator with XRE-family HTH domain